MKLIDRVAARLGYIRQTPEMLEARHDLHTHYRAWWSALEAAERTAEVCPPDQDDKAYWRHEQDVLDRVCDALAIAGFDAGGEVPQVGPAIELIVFRSAYEARQAGFGNGGNSTVRAWWPGMGFAGLSGYPPQRVTIAADMVNHLTGEGRLGDILRKRQMVWGSRAVWVELG